MINREDKTRKGDQDSSQKQSGSQESKNHRGNLLSPQLERVLIENLFALEESINAKAERQFDNFVENDGPKSVRMYQHDRKIDMGVNNELHNLRKMATNTIRELSCESNSLEPSPKS